MLAGKAHEIAKRHSPSAGSFVTLRVKLPTVRSHICPGGTP